MVTVTIGFEFCSVCKDVLIRVTCPLLLGDYKLLIKLIPDLPLFPFCVITKLTTDRAYEITSDVMLSM